ncbi:hypothetical protein [Formosa sp. A9]|uniref:hypothetical protein n=1 Tax=Formosa sp. A9 TaxID=3442641 RepID=UPI003EBA86DB
MKNIALILALVFIASTAAFAQDRSELTGPAYKNYKPGKSDSKPTLVYAVSNKKELTGPAYKNQKPWKNTSEKTYSTIAFGSERSKLSGHEYKNYKPWKNTNNEIVQDTTVIYVASDD